MTLDELKQEIEKTVDECREKRPFPASITNTVTVNFVANAQLAVGGTAAMIYLPDEAETLARVADSFYINMGTLLPVYAETLPRCLEVLIKEHKPWVLDPVGIGAGALRDSLLLAMKHNPPSVIRANASEVMALAALWKISTKKSMIRGVESHDSIEDATEAAVELARFIHGAVAVSSEVDLVTDGRQILTIKGGSPLFTRITGSGCSLGGVVAAYSALTTPFTAAATASSIYKKAGELAAKTTVSPASFQVAFLDNLYTLCGKEVCELEFTLENI